MGGGPRRDRRGEVETVIEVEEVPEERSPDMIQEGGGIGGYTSSGRAPRRYMRADVEAAIEVEEEPEREPRDDTGGRM